MPALWDSKVTFVLVSQFLGLALCYPCGSVSEPFITPGLISHLGEEKKEERKKISLLLTLKLFMEFFLSSRMPQEEGAGLRFSPFLWF